jgi:hypothetical protein
LSWWWLAPLAVAALGTGLLAELARRLTREATEVKATSEGLAVSLARLVAARGGLALDVAWLDPEARRGPGPSEKAPAPH